MGKNGALLSFFVCFVYKQTKWKKAFVIYGQARLPLNDMLIYNTFKWQHLTFDSAEYELVQSGSVVYHGQQMNLLAVSAVSVMLIIIDAASVWPPAD